MSRYVTIRFATALLLALVGVLPGDSVARACPFCTALVPTLTQWREQSAVAALVEIDAQPTLDATRVRVVRVLAGSKLTAGQEVTLPLDVTLKPGALVLVFGTGSGDAALDKLSWHGVSVNEIGYAYFAKAPGLKTPAVERLRYFAPYLEHADPLVAQDAYLEFGHASFEDVTRMAELLPRAKLRQWLAAANVPQDRKGFYGLALGLAGSTTERGESQEFLQGLILAPEDDFRAGFDGVLGGYLLLAGPAGLELIESRYLNNPKSADGDVRHALTALRFYREYGHDIPPARLSQALATLLARKEFCAAAITDLARWKDWSVLERIAALHEQPEYRDEAITQAIVGYLMSAPEAPGRRALARLRAIDPQGIAAAEQYLARTTTVPASGE